MSLFSDYPQAIEAAMTVIPAFDSTDEDVRAGLSAALAALPRDALIEKALADDVWMYRAATWGLIPEHDTAMPEHITPTDDGSLR